MAARKTILLLSQVYVPDPASVCQHFHDAAAELVKRGWRVRVLASARGYDDPTRRYPLRETLDGVDVRRLPFSSFGKRSIPIRLLGQSLFLAQAFMRGLFTPGLAGVLVSTSPPMCSIIAVLIATIRRQPIAYWAMDINPDQMVALGKIREGSLAARVFNWINRRILTRAKVIVALDRFMADRLRAKCDIPGKVCVLPPWPHEEALDLVDHADNPFRKAHELDGKFVVMYSGNHSPANPIDTVIEAASRLHERSDIVFMFIGGGLAKREVEQAIAAGASNIRSLPYQPMDQLRYSLSAADAHVVTIGDGVVGIVHPCKVYGAMAVARPILFVGPAPSHVADLLDKHNVGWRVEHGDVEGAVMAIEAAAALTDSDRRKLGLHACQTVAEFLSKPVLCGAFCDAAEEAFQLRSVKSSSSQHGDEQEMSRAAAQSVQRTQMELQ